MFSNNIHNKTPIQRLTPELLLNVVMAMDIKSTVALALTCKQFSTLMSNDLVFRKLVERDYGITYIDTDSGETWKTFYKALHSKTSGPCCAHLSELPDDVNECKRVIYKATLKTSFSCDLCKTQEATYLNMFPLSNSEACRSCLLDNEQINDERKFAIQLENASQTVWCFQCQNEEGHVPRKLGGSNTNRNEQFKVKTIVDHLVAEETEGALDRRRKAEQQLYIRELRQEDMSLKYYLVEKNWGRSWMFFRTREGASLPGRITNNKLSRSNGSLDPSIRLPIDKYRPSPETHADIVSEKLWSYLSKAYSVQGRAFSEDDLQYPEYTRLRAYIEDFKNSIHAYP